MRHAVATPPFDAKAAQLIASGLVVTHDKIRVHIEQRGGKAVEVADHYTQQTGAARPWQEVRAATATQTGHKQILDVTSPGANTYVDMQTMLRTLLRPDEHVAYYAAATRAHQALRDDGLIAGEDVTPPDLATFAAMADAHRITWMARLMLRNLRDAVEAALTYYDITEQGAQLPSYASAAADPVAALARTLAVARHISPHIVRRETASAPERGDGKVLHAAPFAHVSAHDTSTLPLPRCRQGGAVPQPVSTRTFTCETFIKFSEGTATQEGAEKFCVPLLARVITPQSQDGTVAEQDNLAGMPRSFAQRGRVHLRHVAPAQFVPEPNAGSPLARLFTGVSRVVAMYRGTDKE